ncbi:SGNH/GDSL hydrolase family protein [Erwinia sp. ErVv1]|uniref:SGNH/GDSL hydrolase family protein n=1 Tax=Erwinia sp. ErVv1 TaxID=1603299 RepID=UPI00082E4585|nr:SGNH/GDSL hydrolase family protein [Erwinia sp. ErVv1]
MKNIIILIALLSSIPLQTSYADDVVTQPSNDAIRNDRMIGPSPYDLSSWNRQVGEGKPTYTYVRCIYKVSADDTDPESNYEWAINQDNSWYKLNGHWQSDGLFSWANMFYTDVDQGELQSICKFTLEKKHLTPQQILPYAANNILSFNHTAWSSTQPQDVDKKIERMVVFGDSLSDVNNMYTATNFLAPNRNTWFNGHFTNGLVWHEYLAKRMNITSYSWAVGGATSDAGSAVPFTPGFSEQIASFLKYYKSAGSYDIAKTLFTVLFGGNDFINADKDPTYVVNDIYLGVQNLIINGAKQIAVINLPDISKAPAAHQIAWIVDQKTKEYNRQLAQMVSDLNITYAGKAEIILIDINTPFTDVLTNPQKYNISNTQDTCLNLNNSAEANFIFQYKPSAACITNSRFVFWDHIHPSTVVHEIIANDIYDDLTSKLK